MKLGMQFLMAALLAGIASAQTVPASQAVAPSTPPASNNKAPSTTAKAPASNTKPSVPKAKPASNAQSATKTLQGSAKNPTAKQKSPFAPKPNAPPTANAAAKAKPQAPGKPQVAAKQPVPAPAKSQPAKTQAPPVQAKQAEKPAEKSAPAPEKKAEATPAVAQAVPAKLPSPGKRDPFLSPIAAAGLKSLQNCTSADRKRCLVVDQIVLKGVVQMKSGNIALVENPARRPYYLRENDSLFNGSVVKITGDSVIFREESNDILGRPVSKEVVKKVSTPAV
jgi:hypothetical protein